MSRSRILVPFASLALAGVLVSACSDGTSSSGEGPAPFPTSPTSRPRPPSSEPQGSGEKPNRSTYARACTTNGDCVLVSFAEAPCDTCKCPNYAIAVEDQRRFFDEEKAFRETCTAPATPCLADCAPLAARCIERVCTVVTTGSPPVRDAGSSDGAAGDAPPMPPADDAGTP